MTQRSTRRDLLPVWGSVLVVVAHPDDESFGLGAVVDTFVRAGAAVSVLCFTHGEASTLHGVEGDLRAVPQDVAATLAREYGAGFIGHGPADIDLVIEVDREHQLEAVTCHPSQAVPGSVLWRRLELQGSSEQLRWLRPELSRASAGSSASS